MEPGDCWTRHGYVLVFPGVENFETDNGVNATVPNWGSFRPVGAVSSRWSLVEIPVCAEIARCHRGYLRFTPNYTGLNVE